MKVPQIWSQRLSQGSCFLTNNLWQFHNAGLRKLIRPHAWCHWSSEGLPRVCENVIRQTTGICEYGVFAPDGCNLRVPQSFPKDSFSRHQWLEHTPEMVFLLLQEKMLPDEYIKLSRVTRFGYTSLCHWLLMEKPECLSSYKMVLIIDLCTAFLFFFPFSRQGVFV